MKLTLASLWLQYDAVSVSFLIGETYSSLQYLYRIPTQTLGRIIPETCAAITTELQQFIQVHTSLCDGVYTCVMSQHG